MDEKQFRNKIYWITFLLSILVVWVHSFNAELFLGNTASAAWTDAAERILGETAGQIAVPGFFIISSYLFYRGFGWRSLVPKWKSRVRSVLIPYLLWNSLYYAGYVLGTRLPGVAHMVGKQPVPLDVAHLLPAVISYAYNPVFWYLFQLILLIVLAPAIYLVFRRNAAGAAALAVLAFGLWKNWNLPFLNLDALFYTGIAAYVSLHRASWGGFVESAPKGRQTALAFLLLLLFRMVLAFCGRPGTLLSQTALVIVLCRLWGVCLVCLAVKALRLPQAGEWMKHDFFLYAIHFAWVRLFNKAGAVFLPAHPVSALGLFVLMPLFMLAVSTGIRKCLMAICPGAYKLLSGGR